MSKPLQRFSTDQEWCDYELLSVVAALLKRDGRSVHIPLKDFGSIFITTPAGGYTSLHDLAALILHVADHLEDSRMYKGESEHFTGPNETAELAKERQRSKEIDDHLANLAELGCY